MFCLRPRFFRLFLLLLVSGCGGDSDSEETPTPLGAECEVGGDRCEAGLTCESRADSAGGVCSVPLHFSGKVLDALDDAPVEGGLVFVLDETGTPVAQARTNDSGAYEVTIAAPRTEDGSVPEDASWTLAVAASGYQPFPYGARTALPITANQVEESDEQLVVSDQNTDAVLLPLAEADELVSVDGRVKASAAGALIVAEGGGEPAPFGLVGPDGSFTVFNVPKGEVTLRGYRQGFAFTPKTLEVDANEADVQLDVSSDGLGNVSGSVNIVNAPGGSLTSVVLVPESVFDPLSEKGPVPLGLRVPGSPKMPNVSGSFTFEDVSPGSYVVLAAFENDDLVRDPDTNIGGTQLQTVRVDGANVTLEQSFKVTEHLAVVYPGADGIEEVGSTLVFRWADDSSEDYYHFVLRSALGDLIWEQPLIPSVSGSDEVSLDYAGPELTSGMFYQFRVTSMRDAKSGPTPISRTEDLRGAFRMK